MQTNTYAKPYYIFFLVLPYGISAGFVTVTLPYLLTQKGFSVELAAGIVALGFSANIWRFLWGPVADITLSMRRWYWIGMISSLVTLLILCLIPYNNKQAGFLSFFVFISQVAATLILLPVGGFMAHRIAEEKKGSAGGWFQAGNLGGMGLGGGAGLWLSTHFNIPVAGIILCICMLACGLFVLLMEDVPCAKEKTIGTQIKAMGKDILVMLKMPVVLFIIIMILFPIGTGAAGNLWSAIAVDWKVNADTVALVTGIISGIISAFGCIVGGWIADNKGIWWAYLGSGFLCGMVTILMAAFPYIPMVYILGVLIYSLSLGMCNAGFSASALFATGKKAAATRYSLLSSISNLPIVLMISLDGWAHDHGGSKFMLLIEGIAGILFVLICVLVVKWMRGRNLLQRPFEA